MHKYLKICSVSVLVALSAASCSQEVPTSGGASGKSASGASTAAAPVPEVAATITANPAGVCTTPDFGLPTTVSWQAPASVKDVGIYVISIKGERKLWLNGGATGTDKTGNWMQPGTKLELVDNVGQKPLASLTMADTCGTKAK